MAIFHKRFVMIIQAVYSTEKQDDNDIDPQEHTL